MGEPTKTVPIIENIIYKIPKSKKHKQRHPKPADHSGQHKDRLAKGAKILIIDELKQNKVINTAKQVHHPDTSQLNKLR